VSVSAELFKVMLIIRPETIVRELGETYDAIFRNYSRAVHSLGPRLIHHPHRVTA
jgi:hypothetical protein